VLAAGGIADGRGLAAALTLGAAGALIGTRFYASHEALGYRSAKERIVTSSAEDTLRTEIFDIVRGYDWPRPFTGRCVANSFTRRWHLHQAELFRCLAEQRLHYQRAAEAGDVDTAVVWASESISLINEIESAEAILRRLSYEALNALERAHYRSNPTPQANSWQVAEL
jgi:nitronate monooxygenase